LPGGEKFLLDFRKGTNLVVRIKEYGDVNHLTQGMKKVKIRRRRGRGRSGLALNDWFNSPFRGADRLEPFFGIPGTVGGDGDECREHGCRIERISSLHDL